MEISNLVNQHKHVLLIHTEMSVADYVDRIFKCPEFRDNLELKAPLLDEYFDTISVGSFDVKLGKVPYPDLYSALRAIVEDNNIDVVIMDYINSYYTPTDNKHAAGYSMTQDFSRFLDKARSDARSHAAYLCLTQTVEVGEGKNKVTEYNGDHNLAQTFDFAAVFGRNNVNTYTFNVRKDRQGRLTGRTFELEYDTNHNTIKVLGMLEGDHYISTDKKSKLEAAE